MVVRVRRSSWGVLLCLLVAACGGTDPDTSVDGGAVDVRDAGSAPGPKPDAGSDASRATDAARSTDAARADAARDAERADANTPTPRGDASTAATRDGGPRAYSTQRDEFFGDPRCERDTFLLCEDFESEAAGAPADPQVWQTPNDRLRVDSTRAARGAKALSVTTRSNEGTHFIRTTKTLPATRKKMWGRLFFWVQPPRPTAFSHWTTIEATGVHPAGGTARTRVGGIHVPGVENRLDFNYDIWGGRPAGFKEVGYELVGQDLPDASWHCLEWMIDVPAREVRIFRDGSEETKLAASKSIDGIALDFPDIDGLNIGMSIYQDIKSDSWKVWIDEIAIDVQRIGCSN